MNNKEIFLNCNYIPPEILFTAGFLPLRIWPDEIGDKGQDLLPYDYCPYSRAFLSEVLSTEDKFCVLANSCDAMRRVYDVVNDRNYQVFLLEVPRQTGNEEIDYYYQQLERLLKNVGVSPDDHKFKVELRKNIERYNYWRNLLKKLQVQNYYSFLIKGVKLYSRCQFNKLEELVGDVVGDANNGESDVNDNEEEKPAVIISSSCLLNGDILKLIESVGLKVYGLDSCLGERAFDFRVELKEGGDPLRSLAEAYLNKISCPRTMEQRMRREKIKEFINTRGADGLIYFIPKFCDQAAYDFKYLKEWAQEKGIPVLQIEGEYQSGWSGRLVTRITAFRETLDFTK